MIRINLLPVELRHVERTPLPVFISLVAGVILSCVATVAFAVGVVKLGDKRNELESVKRELENQKLIAAKVDELERKMRQSVQWRSTFQEIKGRRIEWAPHFDEICDICPGHTWLTGIKINREVVDAKGKLTQAGTVVLNCYSLDPREEVLADLMRRIQNHPKFFRDFASIDDPEWERVYQKEIREWALKFNLNLTLTPRTGAPEKQ
ncbi:MAG: hypothetical protein V1809_09330 [Planctomycetota bacterium]